jgi:hypothetical protein
MKKRSVLTWYLFSRGASGEWIDRCGPIPWEWPLGQEGDIRGNETEYKMDNTEATLLDEQGSP